MSQRFYLEKRQCYNLKFFSKIKMMVNLDFPHYVILKASAGSGKTHTLAERFVSFLISDRVPKNNIKNILAITFSNNAAYEMKSRILNFLKTLYLNSENGKISDVAQKIIDEILSSYSDFQVKTIDSFMTNIFKASAYDFEFSSDFEILMNNESLLRYAYDTFLKDVGVKQDITELFEEMITLIQDTNSRFVWDPATEIYKKIKRIYEVISKTDIERIAYDSDLISKRQQIESALSDTMKEILKKIANSGLDRNAQNKIIDEFPRIIRQKRFNELLERGVKTCPVKKNKKLQKIYEEIESLWKDFQELICSYAEVNCYSYYIPYMKIFDCFYEKLQQIKRKESRVFIEDINKLLSSYINEAYVPEIYFKIGSKIYHFFIDEFQDTSPLQWLNLKPLIENSLSEKGSLFIVGDTKQAIYGFRGADYRIMKQLENTEVFPSAKKIVKKLNVNYRSRVNIIRFTADFFQKTMNLNDRYRIAAELTELNDCKQIPHSDFKEEGYVEVKFLSDDEELKNALKDIINDSKLRGYKLKDIAILASKNEQVEMLSFLLSELGLNFLSYSSVDVRKRKVTSEIIHLLKFLDSPLDDFSFSVFIMGDIYKEVLKISQKDIDIDEFILRNKDSFPLYKAFEREFPALWKEHFEKLFKLTGYLPLYDLISSAMSDFQLFEIMPEEEATFIKILELARYFEQRGLSSIKDFVEFLAGSAEDETIWNITLPIDIDAVKVMTIHKAKGLEFPITVVFLEKQKNPSDGMIIHPSMGILKINEKMAEKSENLRKIKDMKILSDTVDLLNRLYVGYTRAEKELYVLCKVNEKDRENFPFNVLSQFSEPYGEKTKNDSLQLQASVKQIIHYKPKKDLFTVNETNHLKEKTRGELIHRILSFVEFVEEDIEGKIWFLIRELGINFDAEQIKEKIIKTIKNSELAYYFVKKPERKIFNEFELCDESGLIHRVDRVVIDEDDITVIEYKTGARSEEHVSQVRLYMELISKIFKNKRTKGVIYYIDSDKTVWI